MPRVLSKYVFLLLPVPGGGVVAVVLLCCWWLAVLPPMIDPAHRPSPGPAVS